MMVLLTIMNTLGIGYMIVKPWLDRLEVYLYDDRVEVTKWEQPKGVTPNFGRVWFTIRWLSSRTNKTT